jgi:hypothetical protein
MVTDRPRRRRAPDEVAGRARHGAAASIHSLIEELKMTMQAFWTHGNALTIETLESLASATRFGWGTDIIMRPGAASWFHVPLASPVISDGVRTSLQRAFVLFKSEGGSITNVHLYDGASKFKSFDGLSLQGDHRNGLDGSNTLELASPHSVLFGIGISFRFAAAPRSSAQLSVATAGGDFVN